MPTEEKEHQKLMTDSEVNKIEHAQMRQDIKYSKDCYDGQEQRWLDWVQAQEEKRQGFDEKIIARIETLTGAISAKEGVDSAIMARIGDVNREMMLLRQEQETRWKDFMEIKVHVDDLLKLMQAYHLPRMADDLEKAWKQIRVNTDVLAKMKARGGKVALRILIWSAITLGSLGLSYLFWLVTGFGMK